MVLHEGEIVYFYSCSVDSCVGTALLLRGRLESDRGWSTGISSFLGPLHNICDDDGHVTSNDGAGFATTGRFKAVIATLQSVAVS